MKTLQKVKTTLICTMALAGLLHADPPAVDIFNLTGEDAVFKFTSKSNTTAPVDAQLNVGKNKFKTYAAPTDHTIQFIQVVGTPIKLDLRKKYPEKIDIVYDGIRLMEKSDYENFKNSRTNQAKEYSASVYHNTVIGLAVAQHWFSSQLTRWKQWFGAKQQAFNERQKNELKGDHALLVDNYSDYDLLVEQKYILKDQDQKYKVKKHSESLGNAVDIFGGMTNTPKITIRVADSIINKNTIELFIDNYYHAANQHPGEDMHVEVYNTSIFWSPWQKYKGAQITYKVTWQPK